MYVDIEGPRYKKDVSSISEFGFSTSLRLFGLGYQGMFGDVSTEAPSYIYLETRLKWNAWADSKGIARKAAQEEVVDIITKGFKENGHE